MKKRTIGICLIVIYLLITGVMMYFSYNDFKIIEGFEPVPLSYDPYTNTSKYNWNGNDISITGGFVKGIIKQKGKDDVLLLRALCPTPKLEFTGKKGSISIENINTSRINISSDENFEQTMTDPHTVNLKINLENTKKASFELSTTYDDNFSEFIILGDSRNGYGTLSNIIRQSDAISPVFVIDNGDLVFNGSPNTYRLFYETISNLTVPIYTTLGNHDIRNNGRAYYMKLFGPPYYSFTYGNNYFIFLDSAKGFTEDEAIDKEQYKWLESELIKAQGKKIFVINHIPSTDPREAAGTNNLPSENTGIVEKELESYESTKEIDHGFTDKAEAARFEKLMTDYKVDTVFTSHIHSYFSFIKDNVNYIISGGAGAELLTQDSFYHYLRVKINTNKNYLEMVQIPSPPNALQDRYIAAVQLFATSINKEYHLIIIMMKIFFWAIILWFIFSFRKKIWRILKFFGIWLRDIVKYAVKRFKEMKHK